MEYFFTPRAEKDLNKFNKNKQKNIIKKIDFYINTKNPLTFAKTLTKSPYGTYRFRINKVRVIFILDKSNIIITRIRLRDEVYK